MTDTARESNGGSEDARASLDDTAAPDAGVDLRTSPLTGAISGGMLNALASAPGALVSTPLAISKAVIDGDISLEHVTFASTVSITDTVFKGRVSFASAIFQHGAIFEAFDV